MHVMSERDEILGTFCPQSCMLMLKPLVRRADAILMTTMRGPTRCTIGARRPAYLPIIADLLLLSLLLCTRLLRLLPRLARCPVPRRPANSQDVQCQSSNTSAAFHGSLCTNR
jgi:hypothetical protein